MGKSVFVKILSGLINPTQGKVIVRSLGNEGEPRILLQQGVSQLFGESIENHLNRIFRYDEEKGNLAKEIYGKMLLRLQEKIRDNRLLRSKKLASFNKSKDETVLQAKLALTAERIVSNPPLIILDEPDWCFSKTITEIYLEIVVEFCHAKNIPIVIITHLHDWYTNFVGSVLWFQKHSNDIIVKKLNI